MLALTWWRKALLATRKPEAERVQPVVALLRSHCRATSAMTAGCCPPCRSTGSSCVMRVPSSATQARTWLGLGLGLGLG